MTVLKPLQKKYSVQYKHRSFINGELRHKSVVLFTLNTFTFILRRRQL